MVSVFSSVHEAEMGLRGAGYITDSVASTTVYLAAALHRPVLLEGPAGSGKTQLAYAVAHSLDTYVERLQCYEGIDENKAIGEFDEALQRLFVEVHKSTQVEWASLQTHLHSRQFFTAGPLARALECKKACVLLIDELDKVDQKFEAQAFKRSCAVFGLGRYLYYFSGVWVDVDDRKRPKSTPKLFSWATPEGWLSGLRPTRAQHGDSTSNSQSPVVVDPQGEATMKEIESMAEILGRGLYRGILRDFARVWNPRDIQDLLARQKVLEHLRAAERGVRRLEGALERVGSERLTPILKLLGVNSLERVDTLEMLKRIIVELEATAPSCIST